MDTSILGPILIILFVGGVYYWFTTFDSKHADKSTDRYVKETLASVEMEKLKTMQEELRLKKEYFEFEKARIGRSDSTLEATYKVKDLLEHKKSEEDN